MTKHSVSGWPAARLLWLDVTRAELGLCWGAPSAGLSAGGATWLPLGEVRGVVRGAPSPAVAARFAGTPKAALLWGLQCAGRAVDFEAGSEAEAANWARAFGVLMGSRRELLPELLMELVHSGRFVPGQ